jgi:hypothetical protein
LNDGSGSFTPTGVSHAVGGVSPQSIALGDLDGDGILDFVTGNITTDNVSVALGDGAGGFTIATGSPFSTGGSPRVSLADANGDGALDILTANAEGNNVTVLLGNGSGSFSQAAGSPISVGGTTPSSGAVGDMNNDGNVDFVTGNNGSLNATVLLGNGNGGFVPVAGSPFTTSSTGFNPTSTALADIDGDGDLDAVFSTQNEGLTIMHGDGTGALAAPILSPTLAGCSFLAGLVADADNDGKVDLFGLDQNVCGGEQRVYVWLNEDQP